MACTVLIVEDAAFMRAVLKQTLIKHGFNVVGEAVDGKDGVNQYLRKQPDLVTMDITMPEMDGLTALKEIRKFDNNAKVIMCSSVTQAAIIIDALKAGASDFITKPLEAERLLSAIKKVANSVSALNQPQLN